MSPAFWSLKNLRTGEEKSFAAWGIATNCTIERFSAAVDRATINLEDLAVNAAAPFAAGDLLWIKRNGVGYFLGRARGAVRSASPNSESLSYVVEGPWIFLDGTPYEQAWQIAVDPEDPDSGTEPHSRSRVLLFQSSAGAKTNTIAQIGDAVAVATAGGGYLGLGEVSLPDVQPLYSEVTDSSCGEIIRMCLKWHPDAVTWFDYTVNPPLLKIAQRGALVAKTLSAFGAPSNQLSIAPRDDLLVSGVHITYEAINSVNDKSWSVLHRDDVGATGFRSIDVTAQLSGSSLTFQSQQALISQVNITARAFWEGAMPWLHMATDVTIENVRLNNVLVTGQVADASDAASGYDAIALKDFSGDPIPPATASNLVNVLAGGQVPQWLEARVTDAVVSAKISSTYSNPETGAMEVKVKTPYALKIRITDLDYSPLARTFTQVTSFTEAEPVPVGVAAAYYDATSVLHYEGNYTLIEKECSGGCSVGKRLNLTGGPAEWEAMNAMIVSISEQLGTGTTQVRFGPPGHLGPQDFIELMRVQRNRKLTSRLQERITGISYGGGAQVIGALQTPQNIAAPNAPPGKRHVLADTPATNPSWIDLNTEDIAAAVRLLADKHIKLRELDYCDAGVAKKIQVLCSAPY